MNKKRERIAALERAIDRLNRRRVILDHRSNRYSWIRVTIFFVGIAITVAAFPFVGWWLSLISALLTAATFLIVATYQNRIDRSIIRHKLWARLKAIHIARMRLDWEHIPNTVPGNVQPRHPFETDLDITGSHSLHQLLNTAVSREGSQRLLDWLLRTIPDLPTIHKRQLLIRELMPLTRFRDKLTLKSILSSQHVVAQLEGNRFTQWLKQEGPNSSLLAVIWGSFALSTLTVILLVLNLFGIIPAYWLLTLICSIVLYFSTKKLRGDVSDDAYYLQTAFATLSTVFAYLESYPYGKNQRLKELCAPFFVQNAERPSQLLRRIARVASAAMLEKNLLLVLIVNALVPWDAYCAYRLNQYKTQIAYHLPVWLDVWFELEALCSLASFAYLNPDYVLPEVEAGQQGQNVLFRATGLGHPLLRDEQKVTNDFALDELGEVVLITGSNMSGKSTFLRTLGINLCLAFAGAPVNAQMLQTSLFRIFTCIKVSDSVTEGYSYFYAEVRRLKALLVELELEGYPLFFLIDEIFKGTNNRERLIGSRSYIRALVGQFSKQGQLPQQSLNCVGCVSTHDLELVSLAEVLPSVRNYHFREEVIGGEMVFDYKLRSGPSPTTNALKIMQLEGLPVEEVL